VSSYNLPPDILVLLMEMHQTVGGIDAKLDSVVDRIDAHEAQHKSTRDERRWLLGTAAGLLGVAGAAVKWLGVAR
jgi:hypothetical protein